MILRFRRAFTATLAAAMLTLALAGCGDSGGGSSRSTTAPGSPVTIEVSYTGGTITGGGKRSVAKSSEVTIKVTADVADEVHVHTYDKTANVAPGAPATITFTANKSGIHEVELEKKKLKLFELEVK